MTILPSEVESNYEVLQTMGGGMGTVYKVRHRHFGETRIIKVMQASLAGNQELKDRFTAEARRGKQLEHPNIARVLDFQIGSNGSPYLVMEYIDGVNLRDEFTRRGGPLDPATVVNIGIQTLAALGYLHSRNLIHRDISPDNLMIAHAPDGSALIKLIDLGIAKSLEDNSILTQTGNFMGKVSYASPEQFGGAVDARSDFYSLGVVLYELLTAAKPIVGANTAACILAHCQQPPRPFSETDPAGQVPEALRRLVLKALEKKPEDRYQTAAEFAEALRSATPGTEAIPLAIAAPVSATSVTRASTPAATVPSTLNPPTPAPATEIITAQPSRRAQTIWLLLAAAIVVAGVVFAAAVLFEKVRGRLDGPVKPAPSTRTAPADARAAGASIAVEAPKPLPTPPPPEETPLSSTMPVTLDKPATSIPPVAAARTATQAVPEPPAPKTTQSTGVDSPDPSVPSESTQKFRADLAKGDRLRKEALAFSNAHQWPSAVTAWQQFIRDYYGVNAAVDHAAYYNLGVAYEAQEQWHEAADAFEHAALADKNLHDTTNLLRLGRSYGKIGRWSDAVTTYRQVLKIDPANDVARRSLAWAEKQEPGSR